MTGPEGIRSAAHLGVGFVGAITACLATLGVACAGAIAAPDATAPSHTSPGVQLTSVTFQGTPRAPIVIIHGKALGSRPSRNPRGGTSNFGLCGPIAGRTGSDFGTQLWLEDETQRWSAGYSPYVDCMGIIVTKYSSTEVVYELGSWYRQHFGTRTRFPHGVYVLAEGDVVNLKLRGVNLRAVVHYTHAPAKTTGFWAVPPEALNG